MGDVVPYLQLTESGIKSALVEARGDLFVASQVLGVTALRLDRAIRASADLQNTQVELSKIQCSPEYDSLESAQLASHIERRLSMYRVVGLDALHDLASMPIDTNSAQNQVKLAAAARLVGTVGEGSSGGEIAEVLRALNDSYQKEAPRIRVTRERLTVEIEGNREALQPLESGD